MPMAKQLHEIDYNLCYNYDHRLNVQVIYTKIIQEELQEWLP